MAARNTTAAGESYIPRLSFRQTVGTGFLALCMAGTMVGIVFLAFLLTDVWRDGNGFLRWEFIQNFPSRFPERAGFQSALWGACGSSPPRRCSPSRSASARRSTWRSTRRRTS